MDSLQTGVMPFMAILAIWPLAIFALIQSIPLGSAQPQTRTDKKEHIEIGDMQERKAKEWPFSSSTKHTKNQLLVAQSPKVERRVPSRKGIVSADSSAQSDQRPIPPIRPTIGSRE